MRERPIIFSGPMVRAILDGRKTQTRRLCKIAGKTIHEMACDLTPGPHQWASGVGFGCCALCWIPCPYGKPGDVLWVREAWGYSTEDANEGDTWPRWVSYRADGTSRLIDATEKVLDRDILMIDEDCGRWRSPIFMPRWASRLTLEVVSVRVERLCDITAPDVEREGLVVSDSGWVEMDGKFWTAKEAFSRLWGSINGKRAPWTSNPWCWVIEFRKSET